MLRPYARQARFTSPGVAGSISRADLFERQADQNLIALDSHWIGRDVLDRRRPRGLAAGQVELAAVARTFDRLTVDLALRQGAAVVRTDVGDGEVGAGDVEDHYRDIADIDQDALAVAELVDGGDRH